MEKAFHAYARREEMSSEVEEGSKDSRKDELLGEEDQIKELEEEEKIELVKK